MQRTTIGILAVGALAVAGCGSGKTFANKPRPASPINLTVYVSNSRVSVSPTSVGAGLVVFTITNQASNSESLTITPAGDPSGQALANTGPINPEGTAQVSVTFTSQGDYLIGTGSSTDASLSVPASIQPATIHIGPPRGSSSSQLLSP